MHLRRRLNVFFGVFPKTVLGVLSVLPGVLGVCLARDLGGRRGGVGRDGVAVGIHHALLHRGAITRVRCLTGAIIRVSGASNTEGGRWQE